ncbi:MAG: Uma2 family endonuclease [Gemmatimonadaceae bacterium]|nr:Uma2 family endonuclease [Gloeobacterales cyanobacterium ES-bin-141]
MQTLNRTLAGTRRFTVDEYYQIGKAGIFADTERTELNDGVIYSMPSAGPLHTAIVHFIFLYLLETLNKQKVAVRMEQPLHIDEYNEPVPDVMVARADSQGYSDAHPTPADVLALVEVADSGLDKDLKIKSELYARAGVGEYWVVDVNARRVHKFTQPNLNRYADEVVFDEQASTDFTQVEIQIGRFFGAGPSLANPQ